MFLGFPDPRCPVNWYLAPLPIRPGKPIVSRMADLDPFDVAIAELLQRLAQHPFAPFVIVLSNGSRHAVPTADHCTVARFSRRVNVDHDDGSFVVINPLHIAQIGLLHRPAA